MTEEEQVRTLSLLGWFPVLEEVEGSCFHFWGIAKQYEDKEPAYFVCYDDSPETGWDDECILQQIDHTGQTKIMTWDELPKPALQRILKRAFDEVTA